MENKSAYQYDIAIAGGGLAGLTLAIQAADAGLRVILFEKENYPFHKVCGEYISMESWDFLTRCGLQLADWSLPVISKLKVSDTKGKVFGFDLPLGGFGVSRYKLDHALYELALRKGVTIHTNCKVTDIIFENDIFSIQTGNKIYTARIAAGSFGKRSNLDVKWNRGFTLAKPNKINHFIGVKYHIRFPQPADTISLHNFINGYCGISQIENGNCCLCYLTTAENLQRSGNSIPQMEKNILSKNKQLQSIFAEAEHLYEQPLAISQISFQQKTQVENHVLLLGDAAGMITPLCGNGMSMAMHSGKIAFENMQLFLSGKISRNEMEKQYTTQWQRHFGFRTKVGRAVQYFFGGSLSTAIFIRSMHTFPRFSKLLIEQTHGEKF
jgi:flavin-dependent dehydrogenase